MKQLNFNKQKGVSMVEIVVTMVVVSIGLLGVASLQANTLRYLKSSNYRSEASQAVYEIADRMRANPQAFKDKDSQTVLTYYNYQTAYSTTIASVPVVPTCAVITACTAQEVANKDIAEWLKNLGIRMNGGAGNIFKNTAGDYDIYVMWKEVNFTTLDPSCPNGNPPSPGAGIRCIKLSMTP
ncbi:type IV pilus modification protein PilV [Undibacterium sp. JH2W]|uniref:type IV pilus modification protein PilV n=1 Tax=Undibacterium sp. JH2W TaxID=3413037 RepID=UPI003BF0EEF1